MAEVRHKIGKPLQVNPFKLSQPMGATLAFLGVDRCMPLMHGGQGCTSFTKVQGFELPALLGAIRSFNRAANDARSAWQPSLPLELAFVESLEGGSMEEEAEAPKPEPRPRKQRSSKKVSEKDN